MFRLIRLFTKVFSDMTRNNRPDIRMAWDDPNTTFSFWLLVITNILKWYKNVISVYGMWQVLCHICEHQPTCDTAWQLQWPWIQSLSFDIQSSHWSEPSHAPLTDFIHVQVRLKHSEVLPLEWDQRPLTLFCLCAQLWKLWDHWECSCWHCLASATGLSWRYLSR